MVWFHSLTGRERALLGIGTALSLIAAAYLVVIEPLIARRAAAQSSWVEVNDQTAWLEGKKAELAAFGASQSQRSAGTQQAPKDVAALETAIKTEGLAEGLTRIAPQTEGRVELAFEAVSYVSLMDWMLQSGLAQGVERLTITNGDAVDQIDATIIVNLNSQDQAQ